MSVRWVLSVREVLEKRDLPRSAHEKVPMICNLRGKDDWGGGRGGDLIAERHGGKIAKGRK